MMKLIITALFLFVIVPSAHAQWAQCDPLNHWAVDSWSGMGTSLDDICTNPPEPMPAPVCQYQDLMFVTYSDVAVLADGSVQSFSSTQDLSQYSATAYVQQWGTISLPDGSTQYVGGWSDNGFVLDHQALSLSSFANGGDGSINVIHEMSWPGCEYGAAATTAIGLRIGVSNFQFQSITGGQCSYPLSCPNGNENASCNAGTFYKAPPCASDFISNTWIVVTKGSSKACYGVGAAVESNTPRNCT